MSVNQFLADQSIDQLREWICASSPRRDKAVFDIAIASQGRITRVSSNLPQERPAFDFGCLQDVLLGMKTVDLARAGGFDLDDPVGSLLPELSKGTAPGDEMKIADLLTHSSGLWIDNAPDPDPALASWGSLVKKITNEPLRFPPSSVFIYSIVERVLLVRALSRLVDGNIYDDILESAGECAEGLGYNEVPAEIGCGLRALAGPIENLALLLRDGMPDWWLPALCNGEDEFTIVKNLCGKAFVPVTTKLGMLRFASGIWGQNGQSLSGSLGFRLVAETGDFAVGWFPSQFERDLTMGILAENLRDRQAVIGDTRMGVLSGFPAEELTGRYDGVMIKQLDLSHEDQRIGICIGENAGAMHFDLTPDGVLISRIPHPSMWVEPFSHPTDDYPCLRIGMSVFVKNIS